MYSVFSEDGRFISSKIWHGYVKKTAKLRACQKSADRHRQTAFRLYIIDIANCSGWKSFTVFTDWLAITKLPVNYSLILHTAKVFHLKRFAMHGIHMRKFTFMHYPETQNYLSMDGQILLNNQCALHAIIYYPWEALIGFHWVPSWYISLPCRLCPSASHTWHITLLFESQWMS